MESPLPTTRHATPEQRRNFLVILFLIAIPLHFAAWPYVEVALLRGFGKKVEVEILFASAERVRRTNNRARRGWDVYIPRVRYRFELNGRMWESANYARSDLDLTQFHAERTVKWLSGVKPQYAWVVPWWPKLSAIDPNAHREGALAAAIAIDALILILAYPLWRTRARRGRPPRASTA